MNQRNVIIIHEPLFLKEYLIFRFVVKIFICQIVSFKWSWMFIWFFSLLWKAVWFKYYRLNSYLRCLTGTGGQLIWPNQNLASFEPKSVLRKFGFRPCLSWGLVWVWQQMQLWWFGGQIIFIWRQLKSWTSDRHQIFSKFSHLSYISGKAGNEILLRVAIYTLRVCHTPLFWSDVFSKCLIRSPIW